MWKLWYIILFPVFLVFCSECNVGFWGDNCSQLCSNHCDQLKCNGQTGECLHGCQEGYQLPSCTTSNSITHLLLLFLNYFIFNIGLYYAKALRIAFLQKDKIYI